MSDHDEVDEEDELTDHQEMQLSEKEKCTYQNKTGNDNQGR